MATVNLHSLTDTWNNGGTTFSGIQLDVTNTASNAASKVLDLQVGSSEIFEVRVDGQVIATTSDAAGLAVGPNGATNPVLQVDCATASAATGIEVTGKAATAGVALAAISSGTNEDLTIDAKGSGTITLNSTGTGLVHVGSSLTYIANTEVVDATNVITAAETGTTFFLNDATEFASTLPAPAAGLNFKFIVTGAPSGADYTVGTNSAADILIGGVSTAADGTAAAVDQNGDVITFADGVAVAGDWVEVISDGTYWYVSGWCAAAAGITITNT